MKRALLTLAVLSTVALTSCKKDYTCSCRKMYTNDEGGTITNPDGTYTFNDSRSRAESKCNDQETTGSDVMGNWTRECEIQ